MERLSRQGRTETPPILGNIARTVEALSGPLGIDASGEALPARLIGSLVRASAVAIKPDFTFCPPGDPQSQGRIYDDLASLRMAGGE